MTTIIYKDGVFYADSLVCEGDRRVGEVRKVERLSDGRVMAFSGHVHLQAVMARYLEGQADADMLAALRDKEARYVAYLWSPTYGICCYFNSIYPDYTEAPYYAAGSGAPFALAALDAGASPGRALEIACARDIYSGGPAYIFPCSVNREVS